MKSVACVIFLLFACEVYTKQCLALTMEGRVNETQGVAIKGRMRWVCSRVSWT